MPPIQRLPVVAIQPLVLRRSPAYRTFARRPRLDRITARLGLRLYATKLSSGPGDKNEKSTRTGHVHLPRRKILQETCYEKGGLLVQRETRHCGSSNELPLVAWGPLPLRVQRRENAELSLELLRRVAKTAAAAPPLDRLASGIEVLPVKKEREKGKTRRGRRKRERY